MVNTKKQQESINAFKNQWKATIVSVEEFHGSLLVTLRSDDYGRWLITVGRSGKIKRTSKLS